MLKATTARSNSHICSWWGRTSLPLVNSTLQSVRKRFRSQEPRQFQSSFKDTQNPGRTNSLMNRDEVKARIGEIGILPGIRVDTTEDALWVAETVYHAGITVIEITMTVPAALDVISQLAQRFPDMVVGAGTVLFVETAARCLDAGACFITSTGLVKEVVDFAL